MKITGLQRELSKRTPWAAVAVGFHNFNLRISNLRVSNPNKLIVDAFLTRCRISMCQGLGQKKHDEISEIDRGSQALTTLHDLVDDELQRLAWNFKIRQQRFHGCLA